MTLLQKKRKVIKDLTEVSKLLEEVSLNMTEVAIWHYDKMTVLRNTTAAILSDLKK